MRKIFAVFALFIALGWQLNAQTTSLCHFDAKTKVFRMDGGNVSYVFGVNTRGELQQLYWGGKLGATDDFPQATPMPGWASFDSSYTNTPEEYVGWGAGLYVEPALKVTFADGTRDLVLHYDSYKLTPHGVDVVLKDIKRYVFVILHYEMDPASGILARSANIVNREPQPITVEQAAAAAWSLPAGHYTLNYLTGRWAGEWTLTQETLKPGERVIESRRGSTGHQANPWFAIQAGGPNDEHGDVWFGALAWSGSWRITVEQDQLDAIRVTGGFNPFDFGYVLHPGQQLDTPIFYGGFSAHGMGGASRLLHHFEIAHILPHRVGDGDNAAPKPRPVIYNSWEATGMNVSEANQMALAEKAAALGVDRFVMDDGWFGQRKTDHAGLGDWYVNPQKFPHGLKPLIDKVHSLGMDFGLWVEPEMVNPDSDLYRKHPDWVLNFPGRPRSEERNQLVLNLARPDVRAYVFGVLDKLLTDNDIAFLKWDYNRNWSEPGWDQLPATEQKKVYVAFVQNLYGILAELEKKHPKVEIESCSGGGGRVDLGILKYADEVWPSDNTDPFDRLTQQYGFTYAYTPQVMMAWVTDSPHWLNKRSTSLDYRILSSMEGSLGIGADITKWNDEEMATAKRLIADYHQVQKTIVQGELYRLISPRNGSEFSANEMVNHDKSQAVFFLYIHSTQEGRGFPRLKLLGLDPKAEYALTSIQGEAAPGTPTTASGAWWMNHGIDMGADFRGDFQAAAFRLDKK
ncbi:MAG: alpha-galactosidase [Acidobacteriota bacterium]|nr:alpha-galactosidase [Acidobacteriota bacterium]